MGAVVSKRKSGAASPAPSHPTNPTDTMSEDSKTSVEPTYRRTLRFALAVAAQLAVPSKPLRGGHSLGEGFFYRSTAGEFTEDEVHSIHNTLKELVSSGEPIARVKKSWKEMTDYFEQNHLECASALMKTRITAEVDCYECRGVLRLALLPVHLDCGGLKAADFDLLMSAPGFIISYAKGDYHPQPALAGSYQDHFRFGEAMGVTSVGALNQLHQVGRERKDFVLQCELRQEQKLASIALMVDQRRNEGKPVKVICIAGPTSSGKTTFATKLCMYLTNVGFVAKPMTVDHYYLPLDRQPKYQARQQRSDVDYDHIESMDIDLVDQHINDIISGHSVMVPNYNMKTGYRDGEGTKFPALPDNGILVIEGIHALNPLYTKNVASEKVFKIFISPLTALQLDDANVVKTTDHRLLRRMCRDYLFRGNSAARTLGMWDNVRAGEGVWIFPHQNNADFVMNSAAEYEIPVLKTFIEPLLKQVTPEDPNFQKATEVLSLLDCVSTWPPGLAPEAALIREFIGEGAYDCH